MYLNGWDVAGIISIVDLGCSDWLTEAEVFLGGPGMGGSTLTAAQQAGTFYIQVTQH